MQPQKRLNVLLGMMQSTPVATAPATVTAEPCAARRRFQPKANVRLIFSREVSAALRAGKPVVALESTIISHGMPYPQNLQTAIEVEDVVRSRLSNCKPKK